MMDPCLY